MRLWVDGDSCHSRALQILLRAVRGRAVELCIVADRMLPGAAEQGARIVQLEQGAGAVDDYIVSHACRGDVAVTRDLELALRLTEQGVRTLSDRGRRWERVLLKRHLEDRRIVLAMAAGGMKTARAHSYSASDARALASSLEAALRPAD